MVLINQSSFFSISILFYFTVYGKFKKILNYVLNIIYFIFYYLFILYYKKKYSSRGGKSEYVNKSSTKIKKKGETRKNKAIVE